MFTMYFLCGHIYSFIVVIFLSLNTFFHFLPFSSIFFHFLPFFQPSYFSSLIFSLKCDCRKSINSIFFYFFLFFGLKFIFRLEIKVGENHQFYFFLFFLAFWSLFFPEIWIFQSSKIRYF